jgi:hypothetical protein
MGKKNAFDGMSRKSTAMSNNFEDGALIKEMKRSGSSYKARSTLKNSNTETGNLIKDAGMEAMVLSLDPKSMKNKKPTKLKPLVPKTGRKEKKITGNYAAEVLADLEERDKNKKIYSEMNMLDREIKGFLNFDQDDIVG